MKILFLSHSSMISAYVVGSHHLARGMASLGHDVLHLSPPVTLAHLVKSRSQFERSRFAHWWRGGRSIDGVWDAIPAAPMAWGMLRWTSKPLQCFGWQLLPSALRLLRGRQFLDPDIVFIDEPRLGYLLDHVGAGHKVYRPTDLYAALRKDDSILEAERFVIGRCRAFIATSEPVAEHLRQMGAHEVDLIENGVDLGAFDLGKDIDVEAQLPARPRAVYAGAFDSRFGFEAVRAAARRLPGVSFVLIGPFDAAVVEAFRGLSNVHLVGKVEHGLLPSFLRRCQAGLLPLSADESNRGRSPMKLYEYAAANLPVVSSWTPELARRKLTFVRLAATEENFVGAVEALLQADLAADGVPQDLSFYDWRFKCVQALKVAARA